MKIRTLFRASRNFLKYYQDISRKFPSISERFTFHFSRVLHFVLVEMRHSCGAMTSRRFRRPFASEFFPYARQPADLWPMNKRSWRIDRIQATDSLEIIACRHRKLLLLLRDAGSREGYHASQKKYVYSRIHRRDPALLDLTWTGQLFENYSNLSAFLASLFRNERYSTREPHHRPPPNQSF